MSDKVYTAKATKFTPDMDIYLSVDVSSVNPLEVKADLDAIAEWLYEKYHKQTVESPITTFKGLIRKITEP